MICAAAKGFLTQADCGVPAASACSHCGRPMCPAHLSPASGFSMCYDCAATQQPRQEGQEQPQDGEYDDTWAHGYRASYYSSTGYRPYSSSSTYDSTDASSFDQRGGEEFEDEERGGGFDAS